MTDFVVGFLIGLVVGGGIGALLTASWVVATEADRAYARWRAREARRGVRR